MNYTSLQQWDIVTVSDCASAAVFMITNDPDDTGVIEHAAGIIADSGPNESQSNAEEDLKRHFGSQSASTAKIYRVGGATYQVKPGSSGNSNSLFVIPGGELVEGVDDLQIQYGIASNPAGVNTPVIAAQYVDADDVADWSNVVSVRMTFTVNSIDMVVNPGDGDGLLRKTFTTTVRLRNRAPA
jgi:type IV pilus assembly protein PilW